MVTVFLSCIPGCMHAKMASLASSQRMFCLRIESPLRSFVEHMLRKIDDAHAKKNATADGTLGHWPSAKKGPAMQVTYLTRSING